MARILICNCKNEFQDKRYGKGKRVYNETEKGAGSSHAYRCTVCGKDITK